MIYCSFSTLSQLLIQNRLMLCQMTHFGSFTRVGTYFATSGLPIVSRIVRTLLMFCGSIPRIDSVVQIQIQKGRYLVYHENRIFVPGLPWTESFLFSWFCPDPWLDGPVPCQWIQWTRPFRMREIPKNHLFLLTRDLFKYRGIPIHHRLGQGFSRSFCLDRTRNQCYHAHIVRLKEVQRHNWTKWAPFGIPPTPLPCQLTFVPELPFQHHTQHWTRIWKLRSFQCTHIPQLLESSKWSDIDNHSTPPLHHHPCGIHGAVVVVSGKACGSPVKTNKSHLNPTSFIESQNAGSWSKNGLPTICVAFWIFTF